ncbi:hypothetical protein, partial [Carboxydothermus pertinax]|uniref:hypothetical protein n=1 Tax=Carboxydothermus pertinax TaxID=870242 RepID=UPI001F46D7D9
MAYSSSPLFSIIQNKKIVDFYLSTIFLPVPITFPGYFFVKVMRKKRKIFEHCIHFVILLTSKLGLL